eukprot:TRINITY_DN6311_c0_g1_i1.p1 TRINITY_DN6311_c0_g1~~TRINITY_DN6311_c0_g1_i1.p1  ORF type:complete len:708 (-),score=172.38 TRINITY_DN6311_c0_g1_i1:111-2093(-)
MKVEFPKFNWGDQPDAKDLYEKGGQALKAGQLLDALAFLQQAVRAKPDFKEAFLLLGVANEQNKEVGAAIQCFQEALKLDPKMYMAIFYLAGAYWKSGDTDRALQAYKAATEISPNEASGHFYYAKLLRLKGGIEECIQQFEEAIRLKPEYVDAHISLAMVLEQMGEIDSAVSHIQLALKEQPNNLDALLLLALLRFKEGNLEEAQRLFEQIVQKHPTHSMSHFHLAKVLAAQGQQESALEHYKKVTQIKPDFVDGHVALAGMLEAQGAYDEALKHFRIAMHLKPGHPDATQSFQDLLARTNQTREDFERKFIAASVAPKRRFDAPGAAPAAPQSGHQVTSTVSGELNVQEMRQIGYEAAQSRTPGMGSAIGRDLTSLSISQTMAQLDEGNSLASAIRTVETFGMPNTQTRYGAFGAPSRTPQLAPFPTSAPVIQQRSATAPSMAVPGVPAPTTPTSQLTSISSDPGAPAAVTYVHVPAAAPARFVSGAQFVEVVSRKVGQLRTRLRNAERLAQMAAEGYDLSAAQQSSLSMKPALMIMLNDFDEVLRQMDKLARQDQALQQGKEILIKVKQTDDDFFTTVELYERTYAELAEKVSAEFDNRRIKRIVNVAQECFVKHDYDVARLSNGDKLTVVMEPAEAAVPPQEAPAQPVSVGTVANA